MIQRPFLKVSQPQLGGSIHSLFRYHQLLRWGQPALFFQPGLWFSRSPGIYCLFWTCSCLLFLPSLSASDSHWVPLSLTFPPGLSLQWKPLSRCQYRNFTLTCFLIPGITCTLQVTFKNFHNLKWLLPHLSNQLGLGPLPGLKGPTNKHSLFF